MLIVMIADRDDPSRGEMTVLEGREQAERMVESALEAGYEQERIRVFAGSEMEMRVSQRPVVSLMDLQAQAEPGPASGEYAAVSEYVEGRPGELPAEEGTYLVEAENVEVFSRDGVRFSSMFRNA